MISEKLNSNKQIRQHEYDEMIRHQTKSKINWMKEKPYQLVYKERYENGKSKEI